MNISGIRPRPEFYSSWRGLSIQEKEKFRVMADNFDKKDFDPKAAAEARKKELDDMMGKIEQGVVDCFDSEQFRKLTEVMGKMPHYSVNNQILIMLQNPEATLCNSFSGWKKVGRHVNAGEKGLRIMAPAPYQMEKEQEKTDANGKVILDKDGEPVKETVKVTVNAFKPVSTFDVAQTSGDPIPQIGVDELLGTVEGYEAIMQAIKDVSPVPVGFEDIASGAKGYFHLADNRIAIQEGMSEVQTVKTALHEVAHAKYHNMEAMKANGEEKSKNQKEIEAEGIAMVCAAHYGIDTSDYSLGYLTGYSSGKEIPELKAALQTIRQGACEIIDAIDEKVRAVFAEKSEEQAKDGFVEFDPAIFEGSPFAEDVPFVNAEVDQPAGFIKIEPPLDAKDFESDKKIEVTKEDAKEESKDNDKTKDSKEKPEKKQSVKKKLETSKAKTAKTPKPKKTQNKNLQEAI